MAQHAPKHVGENVIINTCSLLHMCICWCIEDIIYENMHGMESFQHFLLLFIVLSECLYSCKWYLLRAILLLSTVAVLPLPHFFHITL
jgi:hypothetical protein